MKASVKHPDTSKSTGSIILFHLLIGCIFGGHALAFGAWWYVCPKGFPVYLPRFWTNSVIPPVIIVLCLVGLWGAIRSNGRILKITVPMLAASTASAILTSKLLYPVSMRFIFLVPAGIWIVFLLVLTWITFKLYRTERSGMTIPILTGLALSIALGFFLPWSQRSWQPSTWPLDIPMPSLSFTQWNIPQLPVPLGNNATLDAKKECVYFKSDDTIFQIYPLLRFISRSPDRFWTLFAPQAERIGPRRQLSGYFHQSNHTALDYTDDDRSILDIVSYEHTGSIEINSYSSVPELVYSHLNSYTTIVFVGKENLFVSFSPFDDKTFEITPYDYPFGRPAKFAYLDGKELLHVVRAKNAEKGPFTDLVDAEICADPLKITFYEGQQAKFRIILYDWAKQAGKQYSPTAGWRVPVNAIAFNLIQENPPTAFIHITLGDSSVGRGFDSVGHNPGIYRNHMIIENLALQ